MDRGCKKRDRKPFERNTQGNGNKCENITQTPRS